MSNEVVPFQQMERMALAVTNSKLFGCKTKDEALALMLLAQAENVHPMTAVRDFHLIQGRPAMKAEAMLGRFQQAGGKIQWHVLSDTKAEASFSHPTACPEPVRIDWTIERAQKAGLAGRDIWKNYARAMLRSRCISEGVRSTLPAVLNGAYSPEEAMHIETVEPMSQAEVIESFGKSLPNDMAEEAINLISAAQDERALRAAFGSAYMRAKEVGDDKRMESFRLCYEARKAELETPPTALEQTQQNSEI
jgi:hypothetical protein